jgi:class 3 adenylate cyclase
VAIEGSRSGQLKVLWCVADVWHQALGERPVCHSCGSPVDDSDAHADYKQLTVLFADVVHSMDIASVVGAEWLREIMAALVDRAAVVVQRDEGTVGEFTGDGIMAVLGGRPQIGAGAGRAWHPVPVHNVA